MNKYKVQALCTQKNDGMLVRMRLQCEKRARDLNVNANKYVKNLSMEAPNQNPASFMSSSYEECTSDKCKFSDTEERLSKG